jgi:hypothetical protein
VLHSNPRPAFGVMADMLAWSEELQIVTVPVVRTADRRKFICVMSREALEDLSGDASGARDASDARDGAPRNGRERDGFRDAPRDGFDRDACLAALRLGHARIAAIAQAKITAGEIGVEDTIRITREDTLPRPVAAD